MKFVALFPFCRSRIGFLLKGVAFLWALTIAWTGYSVTVANPTFSPAAGSYTTIQSVTLSTTTSGASIRYTTDGSTPSSTVGTVYSSAISVSTTTTIKAIGYKSGDTNSSVVSALYTINLPVVSAPTFSPAAGTYATTQSVAISSATSGASIRYTVDGSTPSETVGTLYSTAVSVGSTTTLKAIAYKSGSTDSSVTSGVYTLPVAAPTFSPVAGSYSSTQTVAITSATSGASIRYTTDGSTPSETAGTLYSTAVSVATSETLKAIAYKSGSTDSSVSSAAYTITLPASAPTFSPAAGTYTAVQSVTISSATSGASIRYTTDGSTPSETAGSLYSTAVSIGSTETLKAIAYKTGLSDSTVTSGAYTINLPTTSAPTFSPVAGTYTSVQTVAITSSTSGASIRYTTDGSTPSETAGTLYSTAVSVGSTETLKAIAFKTGNSDSSVSSALYTINLPTVSAPTFAPVAGTYTSVQTVAITSSTTGSTIRYTTDGSTPSETAGTMYSSAVSVGVTETLKAIAYKSGSADSSVSTAAYTINLPVATPTFSPVAGTYTSAQTVTIASSTSGSSIRYTTDGTTPSETAGTLYSAPVSIGSTTTLKAIAYKSGLTDSVVASGTFTINLAATATPTFSPVAGTYTAVQTVAISTTTSGASIAYTTDGTSPTESGGTVTHGTLYSTAISVGATETVKAIAFKTGNADSAVASALYTINLPKAATPTFSPHAGSFTYFPTITISTTTSGASLRYTLDGTTPTETVGTLYTAPVVVGATETLKAIAYASGYADSTVGSATYTLTLSQASAPSFVPAPGTYAGTQAVVIIPNNGDNTTAYTTDGTTPTISNGNTITHGTLYTTQLSIGSTTTIKAISYQNNDSPSAVVTGVYSIVASAAAAPTMSPAPGTFSSAQSVTLSSTTPSASIKYTTDGSTPTESNGTTYTAAIPVSGSTIIKAIAFVSGSFGDSTVSAGTYWISGSAASVLNVIKDFSPVNSGGVSPAGLTLGSDGNLYGVTGSGGSSSYGSLYKISTSGSYTALASFTGTNGKGPSTVVQGLDGNFYGTTQYGGSGSDGTVFKATTAGAITTLANFSGSNGNYPIGGLVQGSDGNFYGTTESGGTSNFGVIFQVTPAGAFTLLAGFSGSNGLGPEGTLIQGADGNFYGTASSGGGSSAGTIFSATPSGAISNLHSFGFDNNGYEPQSNLVLAPDGKFYGVNYLGGTSSDGVFFRYSTTGGYTALASFTGANGYGPRTLVLGANGHVYGVTTQGGANNVGEVFEATLSGTITTLVSFDTANGTYPLGLVQGSDGKIYGTASGGITGQGTLFQLSIPTTAAPVPSPLPGTYYSASQSVSLTCATPGATIMYTTDGSAPSETNGTAYSSPIVLSTTTTLRAIAFSTGLDTSAVTGGLYTIGLQALAPTYTPVPGTYSSVQTVTIATATPGASIGFTLDGSTPVETGGVMTNGTLYSAPVPVYGASTSLQAIAFKSGLQDSTVTSGLYVNTNPTPALPVFSPVGGTYSGTQTVTATCSGATNIYYTTDGSTPTISSPAYTAPITVANNTVVKVVGVNSGGAGPVASATFTILPVAPSFSPSGGTYADVSTLSVTISAASGTTIYYTTDGSTPTTSSAVYTGPIVLSQGTTALSSIAVNSNGTSSVNSRIFVLTPALPAAPAFSLPSGTYSGLQTVTLTSSGATSIYYTTDGSTPTTASTLYTGPITIAASTIIQAIGFNGSGIGPLATGTYTLTGLPSSPVFAPTPGPYATAQNVTIVSAGASAIYYTTDGTLPTSSSTAYTGPITVTNNATLRAIGVNSTGPGAVSTASYQILQPATAPSFSPAFGSYATAQTVSITSPTVGTTVRYTTDGSIPTESNGTVYSGPFSVAGTSIVKAVAYEIGSFADSAVTTGVYTVVAPATVINDFMGYTTGSLTYPSGLIQSTNGVFYGVTEAGGASNVGTIFSLTPAGVITVLTAFSGTNGANNNGAQSYGYCASLVFGTDGNLYGTTRYGGSANLGTVFKVTPSGALTTLISFTGTNGSIPFAKLVLGSDGNFYGTTSAGGSASKGTIFKITPTGTLTTLASLDGVNENYLYGGLVQGADGNFYGTCVGGSNGTSVFFKITPTGTLSIVASFGASDGTGPWSGPILASDGNFYGTTTGGGAHNMGTLYKVTPTGTFSTILSFDGSGTVGSDPYAPPIQGPDGNLYCVSTTGVFSKVTLAGVPTLVVATDGFNGSGFRASMVVGQDHNIYGAAESASPGNLSVFYQLIVQAATQPAFSPAPGNYSGSQTVTIAASGAAIRYTTDGSVPSETNGTVYSAPITVASSENLQAIAYASGVADSSITSGSYSIFSSVLPPVLNPAPGSFAVLPSVTITTATAGAAIRYTLDGTTPTETTGTLYTGPVTLTGTATVNAIAFEGGYTDSTVTTGIYMLNSAIAAPVFATVPGTTTIAITSTTPGVSIRYTLDGSLPSETAGTLYSAPIPVTAPTTAKAIAYKTGLTDSSVTSANIQPTTVTITTPANGSTISD